MLSAISITAITYAILFPFITGSKKNMAIPSLELSIAVIVAAGVELFDLLSLTDPSQMFFWKKMSIIFEALLTPALLWFSLTYARQENPRSISPMMRALLAISPLFAIFAFFFPLSAFVYAPDLGTEKILFLNNAGFIFYLFILIYLITALVNLEITLLNTTLTARWKIKFEVLGAGAFLAVLIVYYSHGLLFRTINMQLAPARGMVLIISLTMMIYSRMVRGNAVKVYVSRKIAYRSVVLLSVGLYLVILGLFGEGMQHLGDGFQRALLLTLALVCGLALFTLLLSETAKRRVRLFVDRNFYQNKYDYRNQWLQFTDRLAASPTGDDLLSSIIIGFCDTFGMRTGTLFTLNQEGDSYLSTVNMRAPLRGCSFPVTDSIVVQLAGSRQISDLRHIPSVGSNEEQKTFFKEHQACFLIPLYSHDKMDGFIMLGNPLNDREHYSHEDFDLMITLAKQASSALINLRLSHQLASSREMAALGKVSAFVMHDLKNQTSAISLMLSNAREHITVPEFQNDLLVSMEQTVFKMNALIMRLKHLPEKNDLQKTSVDLLQIAHETAALVKGTNLQVTGTRVIAEADREELQKVVLNLVLNAVEATNGTETITVEVGENETAYLKVSDKGCGIPEDFMRTALFSPFVSTKKKGLGIGLYQSKQIIEAHGGTIQVVSKLHKGSEFTVWLPKIA
ncbi:XrtA/PEP-CTERM system histidine kinase PrsK [Pelotalea chapellei]|uniref:histidine kinase n=1 Tax=Pelotalea chapellei TaxID=44671 RepID=A0ABS5U843_9BACT|nr:XrtA/PEP-CTERM system histidine kinase PrsK [Pelotalea chapellei]MBT1071813.1 PEP-CTERM system histidine kinase PrsK [Pelotalea chapellei]